MRVVFEVRATGDRVNYARVVRTRPVTNAATPPLLSGTAIVAILSGGDAIGATPVGDVIDGRGRLMRRAIGGASSIDDLQPVDRALIAVDLPGRTLDRLAKEHLEVWIGRVPRTDGARIVTLQALSLLARSDKQPIFRKGDIQIQGNQNQKQQAK